MQPQVKSGGDEGGWRDLSRFPVRIEARSPDYYLFADVAEVLVNSDDVKFEFDSRMKQFICYGRF